jgi:hypothetical protein
VARNYEDLSAFPSLRDLLNKTNLVTVSDYPPRECGIATFTRDLIDAIHQFTPFSHPTVIAVNEPGGIHRYPRERVRNQIYQDVPESYIQAAEWINDQEDLDGVSVQHEHGIYGGPAGGDAHRADQPCAEAGRHHAPYGVEDTER